MSRSIAAISILVGSAFAAASATFAAADSDLYWHLATARDMLAQGFARTDTFSWTARGTPLGTDQWLGQLLLYAGYAGGSWAGVVAVRTLAIAVLVGAIAAGAMVRRSRSPVLAVAIAVPAILLSRFVWTDRPELLGVTSFALLVFLLQLPGARPLYAIALLLPVWANLHGSFALGSALVLLVAAHGIATDRALRRAYAVAAAGALLAGVLTPAGLGTLTAPGVHFTDPPREIQEWTVPDPTTLPGAIWALILAAVIATASITRGARARDVILVVPVAVLSLFAIRHTPLFAIAATPYLAGQIPLAMGGREARRAPAAADGAVAALGAILLAIAIALAPRAPDERAFPVDALASLPAGDGLFAQYDWGGWLIWRAPGTPVFVDGRLIPYRGPVLADYHTLLEAGPGWRDVVARRGIRWILVRPTDPLAVRGLELGWTTLARSRAFVLISVPVQ